MSMTSNEIRTAFLDFFKSKGHHIVPSAPMVVDTTGMPWEYASMIFTRRPLPTKTGTTMSWHLS